MSATIVMSAVVVSVAITIPMSVIVPRASMVLAPVLGMPMPMLAVHAVTMMAMRARVVRRRYIVVSVIVSVLVRCRMSIRSLWRYQSTGHEHAC